jgi:hypothetical protein
MSNRRKEGKEWSREHIRRAVWNALHGRDLHKLKRLEILEVVIGALKKYNPDPNFEDAQ